MRRTLQDAQNSRISNELGVCATAPIFIQWLNNAQERLLIKGHWWGTTVRVAMCATDGCITLPPQVATLEKAAICGRPIPVHDMFFEFLDGGMGVRHSNNSGCGNSNSTSTNCGGDGVCGIPEANYRGRFPTYSDIIPTGKQLNLVCDLAADVGNKALCLGYDDNGNWIRTLQNSVWSDGEVIAFAQSAGTNSVNNFSMISDIQLPSNMNGQSWLYEYNIAAATRRLLAHYQYFETRPSYSRYFFPSIRANTSGSGCTTVLVEAIVKLAFIPVVNPTDYLIIENLPALQEMMVGIKNAENEESSITRVELLQAATASAVMILDDELNHYYGDGRRIGMEVVGSSIGEIEPVQVFL